MKNIVSNVFKAVALGLVLNFGMAGKMSAAETSPQKVIRVACVGDSITYGSTIADRQHDSYPAQLGKLLGADYDVRNFGVSGATLLKKADKPYWKQKAYAAARAFKPNLIVIMLGTNDSKHRGDGSLDAAHAPDNWQFKADYVPDYEALIVSFRKVNPAAKIYVCLPTPCFPGRWGINNKTIHDEIIPLVRQVAKDTGASVIDLNTPFAGKPELLSSDGVHPNVAGAKLMAGIIYHVLTGKVVASKTIRD